MIALGLILLIIGSSRRSQSSGRSASSSWSSDSSSRCWAASGAPSVAADTGTDRFRARYRDPRSKKPPAHMTLASHRPSPAPAKGPATDAPPMSDFHLVEGADGWRLTINVTDRLRALLDGASSEGTAAPVPTLPSPCTSSPTCCPGEPFAATIEPLSAEA